MRNYCDCEGSSLLELQTDALKSLIDALDMVEDDNAKAAVAQALVVGMRELNRATMIDIEDDTLYDEGYTDACIELGYCPDCMEPIGNCTCGCCENEEDDEDACDGCECGCDGDSMEECFCPVYLEGYVDAFYEMGICPNCKKPMAECECPPDDEDADEYEEGYRDGCLDAGVCPDCGKPVEECDCGTCECSEEYVRGYNDALKANGICQNCGLPLDECQCDVDDGAPNDPAPKE